MRLNFFSRAPRPAPPRPVESLEPEIDADFFESRAPAAAQTVATSPTPPAALKHGPRRVTRRGHDFDALTVSADEAAAKGRWREALEELEGLLEAHPRAPQVLTRVAVVFERLKYNSRSQAALERLQAVVPAALDRAVVWAELYFNRPRTPAHACLDMSAEDLLQQGGAFRLSAMERLALLRRTDARGATLLHRAVDKGGLRDVQQILTLLEPCKADVQRQLDDSLAIVLTRGSACIAAMLIRYGARPVRNGQVEALTAAALDGASEELLGQLLRHLITPSLRLPCKGQPTSLLQIAIYQGHQRLVEALLDAGADLYDVPETSALPAPLLLAANDGRPMLRTLLPAGQRLDTPDPHTGLTPLAFLVQAKAPKAVGNLLYLGAPLDDPAAELAAAQNAACRAELAKARQLNDTAVRLLGASQGDGVIALTQAMWDTPMGQVGGLTQALLRLHQQMRSEADERALISLARAMTLATRHNPRFLATVPQLCWGLRSAEKMTSIIDDVHHKIDLQDHGLWTIQLPRLPAGRPEWEYVHALQEALRQFCTERERARTIGDGWPPRGSWMPDAAEALASMIWNFPGSAGRAAPNAPPHSAEARQPQMRPSGPDAELLHVLDAARHQLAHISDGKPLTKSSRADTKCLDTIHSVHTALRDEEVLEQLHLRPVATRYLALIDGVLGTPTVDEIFSTTPLKLMPLKRILATVHPDKAPTAVEWASALTQLLNGLRDVLLDPAQAAHLAAVRSC